MVGSEFNMTAKWAAYLAWHKDSIMKHYQDSKVAAKTDHVAAKAHDDLTAAQSRVEKGLADLGLKIDLAYDTSKNLRSEVLKLLTKLSDFNEDHKDDRLVTIIAVAVSTFVVLLALYYFRAS